MPLGHMRDSESVRRAAAEFDELGREEFLSKYGFGRARDYRLVIGAREYDSKAVVGAAHGNEFPDEGPLTAAEFSGGSAGAAAKLRELGFDVMGPDSAGDTAFQPRVWIEKTLVRGRLDRSEGPLRVGAALWSPKVSKGGADVYRFMRDVEPGDYVLHLTDNQAFTRVSRAAAPTRDLESAPPGSDWSGDPLQMVELTDSRELEPPLDRSEFFGDPWGKRLAELLITPARNLFYNRRLELNQGAYLTPAPPELLRILNGAYQSVAGRSLIGGDPGDGASIREGDVEYTTASDYDLDWLVNETLWTRESLLPLVEACKTTQVVLAGPPGTGKTWVARAIALHLTGGDRSRLRVVQFHPSYGYEEFIEGLRPTWDDKKGGVVFRPVQGIVLRLAGDVRKSEKDHYLIIDEMNRANLPRVFGELLYLFEYRGPEDFIELQYGSYWEDVGHEAQFRLPPGLHFLGTMNTADRSIRSIDSAMRRRFDLFFCGPDTGLLDKWYSRPENTNAVPDLSTGLDLLNSRLQAEFDEHHLVGHTFFMKRVMNSDVIRSVWERQVQPLIGEYFFDRPTLVSDFTVGQFWPSVG